jgi:hypothetical protein
LSITNSAQLELDQSVNFSLGKPSLAEVGQAGNTGAWGLHAFGFEATARATFAGVTVPSQGRVGWFPRTERWANGEFFRFALTKLCLVTA